MRPDFSVHEAMDLIKAFYGISGDVSELVSYSDQNFLVRTEDENQFVLKIANSAEPLPILEFQQGALEHLNEHANDLNCPSLLKMTDGKTLSTVDNAGRVHGLWMVRFVSGQFLSELSCHSWQLCYHLGEYLGRLDGVLDSYSHGAMHRVIQWDLMQAKGIEGYLEDIAEPEKRDIVRHFLDRFLTHVLPRKNVLSTSVIHNDANDNNVLVIEENGEWRVKGIIDFGDMVYTNTICELAIAIAYMILGKEDIMGVSRAIAGGYHATHPLKSEEIDVLFDLICIRLAISVCMSARERKKDPTNEYLAVSEAPAWDALKHLQEIDPGLATRHLHDALR